MRSHKLKTALLIGAGTALATALAPASASASAASPAPSPAAQSRSGVIVLDCFANPQVRPSTYLIACGDGNNGLVSLHWSQWGPSSAVARGLDMVNDCQPYCAAGKFHSYPVTVRLDRVQPWPGHPKQRDYTEMHLSYTADTPPQTAREVTYRIVD
ncbi:hypothetical protein NGB36_25245 [Streptomyces sp. RB6PN25]|uniref:Secreted protein n=1 Tax=Streptomyces humicola TaxID=2953240 RepID=A0ABT1Q1K3_9ACTN|nr:hypothetical protein [Streptomyces humicola]MCQ4083808.1 hypothetical protein [Streptomyces humicola]